MGVPCGWLVPYYVSDFHAMGGTFPENPGTVRTSKGGGVLRAGHVLAEYIGRGKWDYMMWYIKCHVTIRRLFTLFSHHYNSRKAYSPLIIKSWPNPINSEKPLFCTDTAMLSVHGHGHSQLGIFH